MSEPEVKVTSDIGLIAQAVGSIANLGIALAPSAYVKDGRFEINHPWLYARGRRHLINIITKECRKKQIPQDHIETVVSIFAGSLSVAEQDAITQTVIDDIASNGNYFWKIRTKK